MKHKIASDYTIINKYDDMSIHMEDIDFQV